jgi:hypothetical protein
MYVGPSDYGRNLFSICACCLLDYSLYNRTKFQIHFFILNFVLNLIANDLKYVLVCMRI